MLLHLSWPWSWSLGLLVSRCLSFDYGLDLLIVVLILVFRPYHQSRKVSFVPPTSRLSRRHWEKTRLARERRKKGETRKDEARQNKIRQDKICFCVLIEKQKWFGWLQDWCFILNLNVEVECWPWMLTFMSMLGIQTNSHNLRKDRFLPSSFLLCKTRQDKARQDKARQDTTRQDKTRQDKTRQDKTRQDKTRRDKTRQDKTRQDKTIRDKTRQDKTRLE